MGRSRRLWGSVRSLASGRYQARCLDPDTSRIVSVPQTFATRRGGRQMASCETDRAAVRSMPVRRIKPSHVDDWVADMIERG